MAAGGRPPAGGHRGLGRQDFAAGPGPVLAGQPDIRSFLHQACLLVLSSRYEALPNVVLEAMAAAKLLREHRALIERHNEIDGTGITACSSAGATRC